MIAAHRRRTDMLDRSRVMLHDNSADFPVDSPVNNISIEIDAKVAEFLSRDAAIASAFGDKSQTRELKGDTRDDLIDDLRDIITGAIGIGDQQVPGITAKFIMPYPRTEQNLIAAADAWFNDTAPPLEKLFTDAGLDKQFRNNLLLDKTEFQTARDNADSANEEHGEAVAAMDALMREIMALSRRRSALVKLKYKNDPGKLAAWAIASHLERPPKKKPKPAA